METIKKFENLIARYDCLMDKDLIHVTLSEFTDDQLIQLLSKSIGPAENLILSEFQSRVYE